MDPHPNPIIKTFKYNSPHQQQPMFSVVEPPIHYKSSNFQDISFSSYLKPKDTSPNDTEISIFDAQKYFSETNESIKGQNSHDLQQSVPRMSSASSVDGYGRNFRTRSFHATPTASSEASWNSQTGLLANPPGSNGVSLRNLNFDQDKKRSFMSRKWSFGPKCCCTGKKSVQVKEKHKTDQNSISKGEYLYTKKEKTPVSTIMSQRSTVTKLSPENDFLPENDFSLETAPRQQRVSASGRAFGDAAGGFSFPVLKPSNIPATKIITKTIINPLEADPPRDSLDVFQPVHDRVPVISSRPHSIDNPVVKHFNNPGSPIARITNNMDDDICSDASSDLFEIESFSTQTTSYPMYRRRDSLDEATTFNARRLSGRRSLDEPPTPSVAATECYAPSEVSVDWSVTTAEGFDRGSVSNFSVSASEIGNMALMRRRQEESGGGGDGGGRVRKGNGGLLTMSCRQEKAVSVGPEPVKCAAEGPPTLMFPVHVGGRPPRSNNNTAMGSNCRLSLAFAA